MERKEKSICFVLIVLLIGGISAALAAFLPGTGETVKIRLMDAANPTATAVTYPDGQQYIEFNGTYAVGDTFTVWAKVIDVTELQMYAIGVTYNDTVIGCVGYGEDEFFYRAPAEYRTESINQPILADGSGFLGYWNHVTWSLKKPGNVSGTGTLAWFEFEVVSWGVTLIDIIISGDQGAVLADPNDVDTDFNTIDIVFDNLGIEPGPSDPIANFDIAPPPPRYVGQTLIFTGANTSSEWGFTGAPDFGYCPLVAFDWDFGDGHFDSGRVVTHEYDTDGTFNVNLTVYDTRGWNASTLVQVAIFPKALGAQLDVMTGLPTYNGSGPFMPARPYRANKEEPVQLFSKVLYNDCPVVNKEVTFAVYHLEKEEGETLPSFELVLVRTAFTNVSGWATVEYRIPIGWEDEFGEVDPVFAVYAYTFIAEGLVFDMLTYRVVWVREIKSVVALPPGTWAPGETACFSVTIQSWDFVPLPVVIILSLYDDLNCSLAAVTIGHRVRPPIVVHYSPTRTFFGDGTYAGLMSDLYVPPSQDGYMICAVIPRYAYVGVGTAYVNLFDAWPCPDMIVEPFGLTGDGQPYCPEVSVVFGIDCA